MPRNSSHFGKGSGVYTCAVCKRQTRQTGGDNDALDLCEECYEVAGLENEISDHDLHGPALDEAQAEIKRLKEVCRGKGGRI